MLVVGRCQDIAKLFSHPDETATRIITDTGLRLTVSGAIWFHKSQFSLWNTESESQEPLQTQISRAHTADNQICQQNKKSRVGEQIQQWSRKRVTNYQQATL